MHLFSTLQSLRENHIIVANAVNPVTALLIQLRTDIPSKQNMVVQVRESLPLSWETRVKSLAPGFQSVSILAVVVI